MRVQLAYGHGYQEIDLKAQQLRGQIHGHQRAALSYEQAATVIRESLHQQLGGTPLLGKIALIVPDDTRLWARGDLYVPVIIDTLLETGHAPEDITIIIALGTHRAIPEEAFPSLVGERVVGRIRICNSANQDEQRLVSCGTTSRGTPVTITAEAAAADLLLVYGGVLHHLIAGYGGGRKYIFPGIAGYHAIQKNHSLAVDRKGCPHPGVGQRQLLGNPVNEDLSEAVELFLGGRTALYFGCVVNGEGEIFHLQGGPLRETFTACCEELDRACCVTVAGKGEFALVSAGGHRSDGQLYQATKALFNCLELVQEGGRIVLVAACGEGVGNAQFAAALRQFKGNAAGLGAQLAATFAMPEYVALRVLDIQERYEVGLCSGLDQQQTEELGFCYVPELQASAMQLQGQGYVVPFGENLLPVQAQRDKG